MYFGSLQGAIGPDVLLLSDHKHVHHCVHQHFLFTSLEILTFMQLCFPPC